jgi:SulP family sulfate permease
MIGQSMINIRAGGRGRTSGITAALCLLGFVLFGASLIEMIPLSALVGVMFMVVIGTFEWSSLRLFKKIPKADVFVIILVSLVTVLEDLAIAVLIGVIVSALIFAWEHGKNIRATKEIQGDKKLYKLDGPLFFGSATAFKDLFDFQNDPSEVIIDFEKSRVCDHSGLEALNNITERYAQYDKKLHLLNLSKECSELIQKADNIVELSIIPGLEWHIADNDLA